MNALWLAPVVVVAIGMVVVLVVARDAARAVRELGDGVGRFSEVRATLNDLAEESSELRRGLEQHRRQQGHK